MTESSDRLKITKEQIEERRRHQGPKIVVPRPSGRRKIRDYIKATAVGTSVAMLLGIILGFIMSATQVPLVIGLAFILGGLASISTRPFVKQRDSIIKYIIPGGATFLGLIIAEIVYILTSGLSPELYFQSVAAEMMGLKFAALVLGGVGVYAGARIYWSEPVVRESPNEVANNPRFPISLGERPIVVPPTSIGGMTAGSGPVEQTSGGITLSSMGEYRCPYCRQEVYPDHPRGMVLCPVCKQPHHADCWSANDNRCSHLH
ncbi:MAG: hypothetical protein HS114_00855 [Anaerolineales bacterium]|nr:hypothetical protein [Anaerolineales bacterium]